jgi:hypothetical protein
MSRRASSASALAAVASYDDCGIALYHGLAITSEPQQMKKPNLANAVHGPPLVEFGARDLRDQPLPRNRLYFRNWLCMLVLVNG